MLKKSLSIFLLFTIIFNLTGVFIVFKIEQAHIRKTIKHQIKEGVPEDELHIFNLSQEAYDQLDWVRPDIEFREGKEMYDIVRFENLGDSIQLHCVSDEDETILFAQLDEMTKKKLEQESQSPNNPISRIVKVLKVIYAFNKYSYTINSQELNITDNFATLNYSYSSPYLEVPTLPPNTISFNFL